MSAARPMALTRLPTGAKMFLILSGALLPLALIAIFATLQTTRIADQETRARLRVATVEVSRTLSIQLGGDIAAVRDAVDALAADPNDALACARVTGAFAPLADAAQFAIRDRGGRLLCGGGLAASAPVPAPGVPIAIEFRDGRGMLVGISGRGGTATGGVFFPVQALGELAEPSGFASVYGVDLLSDGNTLSLRRDAAVGAFARVERARAPVAIADLVVELTVPSAAITSPLIVAMLLPLLMWAAAASIGWFVVDRLLIRPLRRLRAQVGAYAPGRDFEPAPYRRAPAQEIAELGDTFGDITRTVRLHEADLADGLVRQTKLTREVHHRVKNNLQVIASLINFHSRSATTPEAAEAYASIQRRVDALAVVHRYHFAEMEVSRGLELRPVLGELASNIRATAPEEAARLAIALEVEPVLVNQDVAVAVAFLVTELVELAMLINPVSQIRIAVRSTEDGRATLRVVSTSLIESDALEHLLATRYGRVITGLGRQLRSALHHDPLTGAYDITIPITGKT
ncbi:sensor histidine kinase [Sphingomonas japonica]|uniref:histidine kinase n=2 Tax=Sphingomonas japonica TaxID=511662 RepID=A0ABX0U079_9SPHN|nr:histidine kinase dimerization/phosphoacceptor domain -containing protein [Sphingomonas japonica]NIJ22807.1 two-component sensor histidine kinase [Sphingomonas japonica]